MVTISAEFIRKLKARDAQAWFGLWEVFGPNIERMVEQFGYRLFSQETLRDISQETMSRVYQEIATFDVSRGVKFSTWVYTIAKHIVYSELRYRNAQKRNAGQKPFQLDEEIPLAGDYEEPPQEFENALFRAKVYHAIKRVEKESEFLEFEVYRLKIAESLKSTEIAGMVGTSESSVSRYLKKVRDRLVKTLRQVVEEYSWTETEAAQADAFAMDEEAFDAAIADIYAREEENRKQHDTLSKTARKIF